MPFSPATFGLSSRKTTRMVMMMVTMESGHDDLKRRRFYGFSPTAFLLPYRVERDTNAHSPHGDYGRTFTLCRAGGVFAETPINTRSRRFRGMVIIW